MREREREREREGDGERRRCERQGGEGNRREKEWEGERREKKGGLLKLGICTRGTRRNGWMGAVSKLRGQGFDKLAATAH